MLKSSVHSAIRLRGVRHNNLKNFDLDLPFNQLIVITGLSGSGKSSLAFDTLFAEGQRRYIETFSPYARQFFDRMDKPQVDTIEGIPPAIAIEQRNAVKTTRSTVGTMTEICDHMKMVWPHISQLHCRQCGRLVRKDSPQQIWKNLVECGLGGAEGGTGSSKPSGPNGATGNNSEIRNPKSEILIAFDLPLTEKLPLEESLALVAKQGYQRLLVDGQVQRVEEVSSRLTHHASRLSSLTVIQDRLKLTEANRARFVEACEQAYHFGKGKLTIYDWDETQHATRNTLRFSNRLHCAHCDIDYHEPSPALFSFNHPVGACPTCRGFGRVISIDYDIAVPDRSKTLAEGVVKPWLSGMGTECQDDLMRMCRQHGIRTDVPFDKLPKKWQDFVIEGEPNYGKGPDHEWPSAWYGVKGYFRWLESKAYKMHVRVLLSRYRAYTPCPDCHGKRFQPETLLYRAAWQNPKFEIRSSKEGRSPNSEGRKETERANGEAQSSLTLADFYQLPIRDALTFINSAAEHHKTKPNDPLALVLNEVRSRLKYLNEIGLGYLTLDRPTRSLSGGETERVNLTTCLGTRLVNTLFVLDEPSVGLHPRDTDRLVQILQQLRDAGNTVVVVEHEASVMRAANQIIDIGPGHGATGGQVVFQGTFAEILQDANSLTGQYLSQRKQIEVPPRRPVHGAQGFNRATAASGQSNGRERNGSRRATEAPSESLSGSASLVLQEAPAPLGGQRGSTPALKLSHATRHNLSDLSVEIPLGRFVCITGVSGSGKTTLVREVLLPALQARLKFSAEDAKASERLDSEDKAEDEESNSALPIPQSALEGAEHLSRVVLVDQSILGKTPRSNPAVYIGAFDDIRELFAQSELARQRGLNASAFSFNSGQGQCERCRGAGFEKIEMQFLSDVFIRCPDCHGRRYRSHILEVKISPQSTGHSPQSANQSAKVKVQRAKSKAGSPPQPSSLRETASRITHHASLSIADLLESTVDEAIAFLTAFPESRPARRALESLTLLQEVGLGYLQLGQPINTLSGGESQRLKLVRHLAEAALAAANVPSDKPGRSKNSNKESDGEAPAPTLFLFDEPTTGLHFDDVRVLLKVFQRLVDAGHSVIVIEHNLDVIKSADWLIDLGPDAGDQGGKIVAQGTPEQVAASPASHTGQALRRALE